MKMQTSLMIAAAATTATALRTANAHAQPKDFPMHPPADASIPDGPRGLAIRGGRKLLTETHQRLPKNVGNGLNCTNCHLAGGTTANASPWVGVWGAFPEYRSRSARINSLQDRVNDCFERSMNGNALPFNSPEMNNILSYMQWLSTDVPTGASVNGRGFGPIDRTFTANVGNGKKVYADECASCHIAEGPGIRDQAGGYTVSPVWGKDSFNDGAGMARTYTAAAFIRHNMPLGQGGTLTDQESIDVAEYFTHQPRPVFAAKSRDWPKGDRPKDARR